MIVVIPTNRRIELAHLAPLIDHGARFIVVDDSEGSVSVDHPQFEVHHWGDRRRMLGSLDHGFPKRNGACRDFGFFLAWRDSDPNEIIIALDDDCALYHPDFAVRAEQALEAAVRPVASVAGTHLNIIDLYDGVPDHLYPRGFPYTARAAASRCDFSPGVEGKPKFCLGLWRGIFDVNAIDKIQGPAYCHDDARLRHDAVVIAPSNLVSVCSMNMIFRRDVLPAVYQLPMHVEVMPGWVVDRYGDIWGGFILKTLMDLRGDAMAVGEPMIRHLKEGNYTRNIWQEHVCHLLNDEFLDVLAVASGNIQAAVYLDMMAALNEQFRCAGPACSPMLRHYFNHLTPALDAWIEALRRAECRAGPAQPAAWKSGADTSESCAV